MLDKMSKQEIELVFEAFDVLESKAATDFVSLTMMEALCSRSKEDATKGMEKCKEEFDKGKKDRQNLKDRITLIRAKLIQARDSIEADSAF